MTDFGIEDYLAGVSASAETIEHYRRRLRSMEAWIGKPMASFTFADLEALKKRLRENLRSGPHYASIARMFYRAAGMEEHRRRCGMKKTFKRLRPEDILTPAEVQRMIDATAPTRDRALIAVLYETGVRVSELMALNLKHVSLKEANGGPRGYVLWFHKTKTAGQEHQGFVFETVPVLETWLKAHPERRNAEAPLFPRFDGRNRLDRRGAWNVVEGAAKRANLGKKVWPHLLRHSRATHLLSRGVPEAQVKKLLGWTPGSTELSRYSHLTNADAENALLKAEGFPIPEAVEVGRLDFPNENLRPIVPVESPPGAPIVDALTELRNLAAADPRVRQALDLLLETVRQPPRA